MKGMIFSAESVRCLLSGRKSMARRVIKPQPIWEQEEPDSLAAAGWKWKTKKVGLSAWPDIDDFLRELVQYAPYKVGEVIYVKETWWTRPEYINNPYGFVPDIIWYKVDNNNPKNDYKWKSSLFMPEWAARLFREISGIRVEQLSGEYYLYADEILESRTARKIVDPYAWIYELKEVRK